MKLKELKLLLFVGILVLGTSCESINLDTLGAGGTDGEDNMVCEPVKTSTICTNCQIYETTSYPLLTGGIAEADSICNSDSGKPNSGTYKAFLVDTSTRNAFTCRKDWVLAANTTYYRSGDNSAIGTTNSSGLFSFPLSVSIAWGAIWYKTGMDHDYSAHSDNCNNWTDASSVVNGRVSEYGSGTTATAALSSYSYSCDNSSALLCVEQ